MKREDERRSYYRIDDIVGLMYSKLGTEEDDASELHKSLSTPLSNLFVEIDREFNQATNILWRENPTIAQALGLLNRKISLIASHTLPEEVRRKDSYEELMVSISGSGLAFRALEDIPVDTRLSLSLVLKPSDIHITFTGIVVGCEYLHPDTSQPYWVRISLEGNNPGAQEQLIQHVVQKQSMSAEEFPEPQED
ncbi:MAG: hypothetical protein ACI9B9_000294 [Halioglobus sp.]